MKRFVLIVWGLLLANMAWAQAQIVYEIRDVKPTTVSLLGFLEGFWIVVLIGVILFFVIGLIVFLWGGKKEKVVIDPGTRLLPWERAWNRLRELQNRHYLEEGRFKEFYSELSDILRIYIEDRFDIHAPDMTTEEFLGNLKYSAVLTGQNKKDVSDFLTHCDMVKFAKYESTMETAMRSLDVVQSLVEQTKIIQAEIKITS